MPLVAANLSPMVNPPQDGSKGREAVAHVILLIHGIRTEASWQGLVAREFELDEGVRAVPIKYEYFDVVRFLIPFLRGGPIRRIERELTDVRRMYPGAAISIVAHSFGTYATTRILTDHPELKIKRLLLSGSIVPRAFRWDRIADQIEGEVLNECGTHDLWPVLAQAMSWGYGASGRFGFGSSRVRDRFMPFGHSDFFEGAFVRKAWVPYVLKGEIVRLEEEPTKPAASPWHSWLAMFPLQWIVLVGLVGALLGSVRAAFTSDQILVTGHMVDDRGKGVANATITADSYAFSATTDARGRFRQVLYGPRRGDVVTLRYRVGQDAARAQSIQVFGDSVDLQLTYSR